MTLLGVILSPEQSGLLDHTIQWDAHWYLKILREHYQIDPASPAFYPLFPSIVGILSAASFHCIPYPCLGLLVNTLCLGLAITALLKISREFDIQNYRYVSIALFLAAPAAVFMHLFYTEAVFIALGFWAYVFALQRRWLFVATTLAFLTAARLPSLLFLGLCGLEFLRAHDWRIGKAINRKLTYFFLAFAGFVFYGIYLLTVRGNFFAMFSAYKATHAWGYLSFQPNFLYSIFKSAFAMGRAFMGRRAIDKDILVNYTIPLLCLTILFVCSVYLLCKYRGKGIPVGIFGLCSIVFFTVNNSLVAVHRYSLPCFGIYIGLTLIYVNYQRARIFVVITGLAMVAAQGILIHLLFVTKDFAG